VRWQAQRDTALDSVMTVLTNESKAPSSLRSAGALHISALLLASSFLLLPYAEMSDVRKPG